MDDGPYIAVGQNIVCIAVKSISAFFMTERMYSSICHHTIVSGLCRYIGDFATIWCNILLHNAFRITHTENISEFE